MERCSGRSTLSLILAIFLALLWVFPAGAADSSVEEVRALVDQYYITVPPEAVHTATSVEGILKALDDPHSGYFTAEEFAALQDDMEQNFSGVGIFIEMVEEGARVVAVVEGSPAREMGLKAGDVITHAGTVALSGLPAEEVTALLRGPDGSRVQITVKSGERVRTLTLQRRQIHVPTVRGEVLNGHIGYLDVDSFGESTVEEFRRAVNSLQKQKVDSWVVDLRYNPGGYVESASLLAGYFIGDQPLMRLKERGKMSLISAYTTGSRVTEPVVFIINEYSASAAELLAAAVQDYGRAILIGTTTYGKGSMQEIFPLENGDVLKLTVAHFFSPKGHRINQQGVTPDIPVKDIDPLVIAGMLLK